MARTVSVILDAKVDAYAKAMGDAEKATRKVADAADGVAKATDKAGKEATKAAKPIAAAWEKAQDSAIGNQQAWDGLTGSMAKTGAAAAAAVGMVIREYATFDQAMSGVAATGADAKANIDALTEAAKRAGADTAFSAVEAANGVEELARAGVTAADTLGGGLTGALDLAAAGQLNVAEAAGIASTAMTQFKLSGEQVPHLADLLAAGAGKAMGGVSDLGAALKQSGLVASQFGLGIEETVGTLSSFAAAGLLGSDAGTSFKSMLLALANPSKQARTAMEEMGIAAYDAAGNFVGIEALAGQLKTQLQGVTDAERQKTLALIFGTDAIRAASVLYEQGAEGIAEWTDAVNESGYAAQQAADLQDNLLGDLEKLGGSLSTLSIEMGAVADGPMRSLVQGVTALIDAVAGAPAATTGLMVIGTAIAGIGLGAAALMKYVSVVANFRTNLATLADSHPKLEKAATAMGKLGKAVGIAAAAFAGIALAKSAFDAFDGIPASADVAAAAVERLAQGTGDLDALFRTASGGKLVETVDSLSSAMERYAGRGIIYMDQLDGFMSGLVGSTSDLDKIRAQFALLDQELAGMDAAGAQALFTALRSEADASNMAIEDLIDLLPQYRGQIDQLAAANGLGELSATQMADAMQGTHPPLTEAAEAAAKAAAEAQGMGGAMSNASLEAARLAKAAEAQREAMNDIVDAYNAARDAVQGLNDAQRAAASAWASEQAATDQWIASLQEVDKQIKDNGKTLDENTEKGRANRAYLRELGSQARDVAEAMLANGASVEEANAAMAAQREQLIGILGRFGIVGDEAQAYADQLGLIPNYVETIIAAPGATMSTEQADALNAALDGLPDEVRSKIITIAYRDGYDEAMRLLRDIDGREARTYIRTYHVGGTSTPTAGRTVMKADGGYVRGPGTSTSDSIPAWLSDREYVIRAAAVARIGVSRLDHLNRTGELPKFAGGGLVTTSATSGALSHAGDSGGYATVTNIYNLHGREAYQALDTHLRDGSRRDYQTAGVHR